jgi:hypothetical protein
MEILDTLLEIHREEINQIYDRDDNDFLDWSERFLLGRMGSLIS